MNTIWKLPLVGGSLFLACFAPSQSLQNLRASFLHPPHAARPHTWWHWINGNITKAGIRSDLEAMKRVGLGGAQIFNVDPGIPHGNVQFMSPQWVEMTRYAVEQADRLGLELCIHNGAGWSSSGGPWVKPQDAMQVLTWSVTQTEGDGPHQVELPQPKTRDGYYRDLVLLAFPTPADQAVVAELNKNLNGITAVDRQDGITQEREIVPGGATIDPSQIKIGTTDSKLAGGTILVPNGNSRNTDVAWNAPPGSWTILRIGHTLTGATNEPAPAEGRGLEVDKLSRAALDHYWDGGMMGRVLAGVGSLSPKTLNNVLIDSYEVGSQNWTPSFRKDFVRLRGYDPMVYLADVAGYVVGGAQMRQRFLWDFRRTIADLWAANYYGYFKELAHKHGMEMSVEPYGNGLFDTIQSGGAVDIPMGEFWVGGGDLETCKMAASAGHVYGKPVVGAESFTADTAVSKYKLDPFAIKALGDAAFCVGINRFIFHEYALQPWESPKPGMSLGPWGTHFGRGNTWWNQGAPWIQYLSRSQALLQSGRFYGDACYFVGENAPNDLPGRDALRPRMPVGFDYDGIDTNALLTRLDVRNGKLGLPNGITYKMLVLPEEPLMTPAVARWIKHLVTAGATVVGPAPQRSPSLVDYPECDNVVRAIARQVWGNVDGVHVTEHKFGKGRVVWGESLDHLFARMGVARDFKLTAGAARLADIHRVAGDAQIYFVSNQKYRTEETECEFRVKGLVPELWHPDTGVIEPAPVWRSTKNGTAVQLRFEPAGSVFVVFRPGRAPFHLARATRVNAHAEPGAHHKIRILSAKYGPADGSLGGADVTARVKELVGQGETTIPATNAEYGDPTPNIVKQLMLTYQLDNKLMTRVARENDSIEIINESEAPTAPDFEIRTHHGLELIAWKRGTYDFALPRGDLRKPVDMFAMVPNDPDSVELSGAWMIGFPPNLGAPPSARFDRLRSWTDVPLAGIKYFSGTAEYSKAFYWPKRFMGSRRVSELDLGGVKNIAHVWLNKHDLGILWKTPFRMDIGPYLRAGHNDLRVQITNLWPNRMIGDEQLPNDIPYNSNGSLRRWPDWLLAGKARPTSGRITFSAWRYYDKNSPLFESGLIGPVVVRSARVTKLK